MLHSRAGILATTSARELRGLVQDGDLVRIAYGMYVDGVDLSGWPEQIHAIKLRAHSRLCAHVVSHVSAAVLHGLPVPAANLAEVHFSRPGRGGNDRIGDRLLHTGELDDRWVTLVDDIRVTTVARTLVDTARTQPHLAAVAAMDAALHRGLTDPAEIVAAFEAEHRWVGSPWARAAMKAADGRSESPGETWARLAVADLRPGHELQFDIYDESGEFVARPDGGWPSLGLVWEYDGQGKYEELRTGGMTREEVIAKQNRRQSKLERLDYTVIRAAGEDLPHPQAFRERVAGALMATSRTDWTPSRGRVELVPPVTIDVRDPIRWAAAWREERYERWLARRTR